MGPSPGALFCSWVIIGFTVVVIMVVFDPLGGKVARFSSAGPTVVFNPEASQLIGGLRTAATSVWEKRVKLLCCCVEHDDQSRMAFSSTAELFSTYFSVSCGRAGRGGASARRPGLPRTHMKWALEVLWAVGDTAPWEECRGPRAPRVQTLPLVSAPGVETCSLLCQDFLN